MQSIHEQILQNELKEAIIYKCKKLNIDLEKFHHNTLRGLTHTISKIINKSVLSKYCASDIYDTHFYNIYSSDIVLLNRNKIVQELDLYQILWRKNDSTYHRNNSRGVSNGYSHTYTLNKDIDKKINATNHKLYKMIKHNEKFKNTNQKYKNIIENIITKVASKERDKGINYLKIEKDIFLKEYESFTHGFTDNSKDDSNDNFAGIITKVFYWSKDFVYVDNTIDTERLEGLGRSYTLIGLMEKELRHRLFKNHHEIDLNSAVQSIFMNIYYLNIVNTTSFSLLDGKQIKQDFPEHYKLLTNKIEFRRKIGRLFCCDVDDAKIIITHLTYSPNSNVLFTYAEKLDKNQKWRINQGIKNFVAECNLLREKVLEKLYYKTSSVNLNRNFRIGTLRLSDIKNIVDEDIRVDNFKKKKSGQGSSLKDRITSRINELIENQIRTKIITFIQHYSDSEIYQIHDAVIVKELHKDITLNKIQKFVAKELKMNISLSHSIF